MPVTRTDFITDLRRQLLDTVAPFVWADQTLALCVVEACNEHSLIYPRMVRGVADVINGQQEFDLWPVVASGLMDAPTPVDNAEVIALVGVELPAGTPICEDRWNSTTPARSTSSRGTQGYRWRQGLIRLRNPASGLEVGGGKLVIELIQTWNSPINEGDSWNGPESDRGLILMLARRNAYQMLAEWQIREQGVGAETIPSGNTWLHIDIAPILAALEVQITRALDVRANRTNWTPPQSERSGAK